ncbi:hypothetical protein BKA62DRAFT_33087 [Auriculariales sp. MPI-PUGE-AT-0066]|nr:hypothetical protein BKA62DRAFT_33087 [Auriculariales sp. MPI-PUGE-AT-0066]
MRLMSASIFAYDWVITLPCEFRLYRRQRSFRPSVACCLFIAARYLGAAYIISTTVLFFGRNFTEESCRHIVPLGGFFRGTVSTVSAITFLWRTWAIWQRNRMVLIIMTVALIPQILFSYPSAFMQVPVVKNGGCTGASGTKNLLALKWPFALVNLLYDTLACGLASWKLYLNMKAGVSRISFILLSDGLGYFFLMVILQGLNLSFLLLPDPSVQTIMVTFQSALSSILAQRIITSLSERVELVPSSDHGKGGYAHDRSRSTSRTRRIFGNVPRPPQAAATWNHLSRGTGTDAQVKSEVEMVKIHIDVSRQMTGDDGYSEEMRHDRGRKPDVTFV